MVLIWFCPLGCAALVLWNLLQALVPNGSSTGSGRGSDRADRWKARGKALGQAVVFSALTVVFGTYAFGGSSDSTESTQSLTATLMAHPLGVVVPCLRHSRSARSPSGRWGRPDALWRVPDRAQPLRRDVAHEFPGCWLGTS